MHVTRTCPHCGGHLYAEPDVTERLMDLVCLQCSRRFPYRPRLRGGWRVASPAGAALHEARKARLAR